MTRSSKDRPDTRGASASSPAPAADTPLAEVGQVAYLEVVAVNNTGAFLGWGRPKDLLLPFNEQPYRPAVGKRVLVIIFEDDQGRPTASMRLDDFLHDSIDDALRDGGLSEDAAKAMLPGRAVTLVIGDRTDLGLKAVVEDRIWGLLYHDELPRQVRRGERVTGYVKQRRDDGRLDLSLMPAGGAKRDLATDKVLAALDEAGGFLPLTDKSPAPAIKARLGVSKNAFKQAIGGLYKARQIVLEANGIRRREDDQD
ncbi:MULTISPECIES: CvfB family protein [Halomonadaceae]|uniref:CvfB family protein n=1 Tax=Halomonadaceae TaxID=28256 RepID=UPI0015840178|nr:MULTISPECIES: S1-like domain-containing RNA-binding protein [Halomonas]MDI4636447.1 S1-like domain-containing RNA-binding protein [Halomonas sp. BMC7]NUJ60812.1 RNA-binding protein [Halomonas taeanensis]